ncbi:hypothetical protein L9F63_024243, partial [Diploptera punctata]
MDIYSISEPVIKVSRFLGILPFSINENKLEYSKFWIIYSIFWFINLLCGLTCFIYFEFKFGENTMSMNYFSSIVVIGFFVLVVCTIQIMCLVNGRRTIKIIKNIHVISKQIEKKQTDYIYFQLVFSQLFALILAFIGNVNMSFEYLVDRDIYEIVLYAYAMSAICLALVTLWSADSHFICLIIIILQFFSHLNTNLKNSFISNCSTTLKSSTIKLSTKTSECKVLLMDSTSKKRISELRYLHGRLCDVSQYINKTYSLQILLSMIVTFLQITWFLYSIFLLVFSPQFVEKVFNMKYCLIFILFWILLLIMKIVTILLTCSSTSEK